MFALVFSAFAQDPAADPAATGGAATADAIPEDPTAVPALPPELAAMLELERSLTYATGDVDLGGGKAVLHVPDTFGYLDPAETDRVLQAWGNPSDPSTWGMLVPAGASIFGDETWAIVVSYSDDGHVSDDDAADIDFGEILGQMQESAREESADRVKAGLAPVSIVGWAEPPHYDAATHKIYWAKELDFGQGDHTLNYAIRALGREGVLELNAVASMAQLATIRAPMEQAMGFAEFKQGSRYEEFDASTDRAAAYGVAALVAGGVAAKTGLFKGLIALLVAGKKLVVVAVAGVAAFVRKLLGKKDPAPKA